MTEWKEFREWIQLGFIVIGGLIALRTYVQAGKQRRLENALKVISLFNESLAEDALDRWRELFKLSSEPAGAKPGHYISGNSQIPIANLFSEGSIDNGAIARMAASLEVVCFQILEGTVDERFIWFELGQLMKSMHHWLSTSPTRASNLLISEYPSIRAVFQKKGKKFDEWPSKVFAYVE